MTITMNLEVEAGVSLGEIASALSAMGEEYLIEDSYLTGNFEISGAYYVFRLFNAAEEVAAEGVDVGWMVGMSGAFHCPIQYLSEGAADIRLFLTKLSVESEFKFVLSFQYESVYGIRDDSGVRFIRDMVD